MCVLIVHCLFVYGCFVTSEDVLTTFNHVRYCVMCVLQLAPAFYTFSGNTFGVTYYGIIAGLLLVYVGVGLNRMCMDSGACM